MKRLLLAIALSLVALPALAASCTIASNSIAIVYVNNAGTCTYSPYATISATTATAFLTWCEANYIATPSASTPAGCFNTWANDWFNQTVAKMLASSQTSAATTAAAAVAAPAITPAQ